MVARCVWVLTIVLHACTYQGFADPFNFDRPFIYPANTGISYSFTDDGYFEEAQVSFGACGSVGRE